MKGEFAKRYMRNYYRRYRAMHEEKQKEYSHAYYMAHREKYIAYQRKDRTKTMCDVVCNKLLDLRRHLRDFCAGGEASEDVLEFFDCRNYFCKSDCDLDEEVTDEQCLECARKRLNAEVEG